MSDSPAREPPSNDRRRRSTDSQLRCEDCENYEHVNQNWHIQRGISVPMLTIAVMVVMAAGGWVWELSSQAADSRHLKDEVADMRTHAERSDQVMQLFSDRLTHVEDAVTFIARQYGYEPRPQQSHRTDH